MEIGQMSLPVCYGSNYSQLMHGGEHVSMLHINA